jgi:hypothetical protein
MNYIEHYYQNIGENWFSYARLYADAVRYFDDGSKFVEVGCWKGRSVCFLGVEINNSGKKISVDCIDHWLGSNEHQEIENVKNNDLYEEFLSNIDPVKHILNPIRMSSLDAVKLYDDESLDFVFVDASHEYEDVKQDIEAWYSKVKKGGIFAGHDYHQSWPGVMQAVDEFFPLGDFVQSQHCWIHKKQ